MKYDFGNIKLTVVKSYEEMSHMAAEVIALQVNARSNSVLGLATGGTPIGTYKQLINLYKEGKVDFSQVTSFNLDEYLPIKSDDPNSYRAFMEDNLFSQINIKPENINIPNGQATDAAQECKAYDSKLCEYGYTDIQLLGIGLNGHIAFNEPSDNFASHTHVVKLDQSTINANARFFKSIDEVPTEALTMGIGSIMMSKKILLLANGANKAEAIEKTIFGKVMPQFPSSVLQLHRDVCIIITEDAAANLKL